QGNRMLAYALLDHILVFGAVAQHSEHAVVGSQNQWRAFAGKDLVDGAREASDELAHLLLRLVLRTFAQGVELRALMSASDWVVTDRTFELGSVQLLLGGAGDAIVLDLRHAEPRSAIQDRLPLL